MLGPPDAIPGQAILGLMILGVVTPSGASSPRPVTGVAKIQNTTVNTQGGVAYIFKGNFTTGKGSVKNPYYPASFSEGVRINPNGHQTDTWTPVAAAITFTSSSKVSRGGYGHWGDVKTKRSSGPGSWDITKLSRKLILKADVISAKDPTITIALT